MANESFEKLLQIFEGPTPNSRIRISDLRRSIIIQALRIAIDSGRGMGEQPARSQIGRPFDLKLLTFSERMRLKQLRESSITLSSENALKYPNDTLVREGLALLKFLDGDEDGLALLSISPRGLAAR